ncbi:MAG TPA: transglycosylase SLT domain-containing protein [Methylomirabilota bacterium]|nr:transglycosylase SLT domain-containing protein [Methylomirabilota bacterium]
MTEPASPDPGAPGYRVHDNAQVRHFLEQFQTGYRRAVVERWLMRAGRYLPMILDVFRQKGLPEELVFTAMIESGFDPVAVSRAGAKGLWQFMAPTARRYGLRVDRWLDERLDPEKSTVAAAHHLRDLYTVFGSWDLVQAAYNAGEEKVQRAIRGMGTSDFWALVHGHVLKAETKNFVPAIHAATLIGREPERYGFIVAPEEPLRWELVKVPGATRLSRVAALAGLAAEDLEQLNPQLRLMQTPPGPPYHLKVPAGTAERVREAFDWKATARRAMAALRDRGRGKGAPAAAAVPQIHVVKQHETAGLIAKRYGITVAELIRWNELDDAARIRPGDRLRVAGAAREEEQGQGGFR